ncbi:MAG: UDP-N-acetylmuramoyl-tripeptide--D-alanyl-D-alanine ligase, partial [bacterium]|nr:UDP-N-acetylmuramoyl-tripeptide--D-alanyl-D-alanine ligase [bacterium]MDW8164510.1 UDP-N-acetylmuramoyl-tripeptide--D-alanyl-D-alanine ligase [Candidatus Omnitrophota bacterium]
FKIGASASIFSNYLEDEDKYLLIKVKDTLLALGDIAKNYRKKLNMHIIGITGSDGKTTTKEIIKEILSKRYKTIGTIGNFNNQIGLPLSILQSDRKSEFGVFEMGMNKKGEIDYLSKICMPNSCVITNIGVAHIGFFNNRKEIAEAKSEVFKNMVGDKNVFLNKDSPFFNYLKKNAETKNLITVGVEKKADLVGKIIEEGYNFFIFDCEGEIYKMNFWNSSFIYSGLFGIAFGKKFGISKEYIKDVLNEIRPITGRGEFTENEIFIIDESYNSNPNSLKNSLLSFEKKGFKRKIAILGDMAELGRFTGFYHWYIGSLLKNLKIDIVYTYGEKSKIISDVSEKGKHFYEFENLKKELKMRIKKEDAILVKGSRILRMEEIVNYLKQIS